MQKFLNSHVDKVGHRIEAGRLFHEEFRGGESAACKGFFRLRGVGEGNDLIVAAEHHVMLADDRTAAHRGIADFVRAAFLTHRMAVKGGNRLIG